jgi:alkylation response protein AidB-like acyl-CoA dehydrogenase
MSRESLASGLSFVASRDEDAMVDAARRYCQKNIKAVSERYGEDYIPTDEMREILRGLTDFGFVSGPIAAEHGGLGLSWKTFGLLLEELFAVNASIGITAFIQTMFATLVEGLCSAGLRERYLPPILAADMIGCIGISEPDAGSNVVEVKTRAKPVDGGYAITGEKTWISNGAYSDLCICVARTGDKPEELDLFLVERSASPYDANNIHKMALNSTSTAQLFFDACRVPEANRLTRDGKGLRQVASMFGVSRPLVGMFGVGVARTALDAAMAYAQARRQHGKPIAGHQMISSYLAEMKTKLDASRLLTLRALDLLDRGVRSESESAMAKWFATEMAVEICDKALQIHGGNGVTTAFPVERLYREARVFTIPEGTTEINKLIIGRQLTGIGAF